MGADGGSVAEGAGAGGDGLVSVGNGVAEEVTIYSRCPAHRPAVGPSHTNHVTIAMKAMNQATPASARCFDTTKSPSFDQKSQSYTLRW
eukprot:COSAG02_NODE_696_length_18385_cov_48.260855_19_plen_89_part_00